jgi:2-oxoglutarate ferredoxin oxidoreductase subunit gamma
MRKEIMFAGSGGQGVITASIIYAEAAALYAGFHVVQSQAYGPEARGGTSNAHVILNDIEVGFPKVTQPHVMVCLNQDALDKFGDKLRPGGLLLTDSTQTRSLRQFDARVYSLPMHDVVTREIGLPLAFNVCVLGALAGLVPDVGPEALREVLRRRIPARYLEKNLQAFERGLALGQAAEPWRAGVPQHVSMGARGEVLPGNGNGRCQGC